MVAESLQKSLLRQKGQALLELILAIVISTTILISLTTGIISAREGLARTGKNLEAELILQKEIEALRSVKETGWNLFATPGTYHTQKSGNGWTVGAGIAPQGGFDRGFTVANVCRASATSTPISCSDPQAIVDPSTKEITVTVSWPFLGTKSVSSTFYLTRYFGNQAWTQTTEAEFNAGTLTNTVVTNNAGGEIELAPSDGGNWNNPQVVASRDFTGTVDATDVFVENNKAYVVSLTRTGADFFIYDVATPNNPTLLGSLDLGANAYAVVVSGNYAYAATSHDSREVTVIDVSTPATPTLAGTHFNAPTGADGRGVAISGNNAYLVTNNNTTNPGREFYSINISDPTSPTLLGGLNLGATATDIFVLGDFAYITSTTNNQELQVVNISNPASPTFAGSYNSPGNSDGTSIYVVGTTAYLTDSKLNVLDVSNPSSIQSLGSYPVPGATPLAVFVSGNFAFLGTSGSGSEFQVVDVSDPSSPSLFGSTSLGNTGLGVFVVGDYAYAATAADSAEFQVVQGGVAGAYQTSGTFESQTFDAGATVSFNYVTISASEPASTDVKFQIASSTSDGPIWTYLGPDGTSGTYFDNSGPVYLTQISGQYFRFKATLTGNGTTTPTLLEFTLNYSP
ncbi:MAG: hypothetical protein WD187_02780 [Candidatus Woykebacteria bacterium]